MTADLLSTRIVPIVVRSAFGLALVSWRYLWLTTPLHRREEPGDESDLPLDVPEDHLDERCQQLCDGAGPLFHRHFSVAIEDAGLDAPELMAMVMADFNRALPSEVATFDRPETQRRPLQLGEDCVVRMPGPWNGPVRVIDRADTSFRFATLRGHLEAGQIEFSAAPVGNAIVFEIETWARPGSRLVHLLYTRLRLAKEIQLNMWVRFCLQVAKMAGGRPRDGVRIHTRELIHHFPASTAHSTTRG
ncbi:DUF1990 family protein [Saccharopolyspora sp. NPDC049357]|uniref:DUF1990 family protein n=1 Tax=Saccharopolyspora sp. NPDC049357 TaxID=3154507 RepID=UPI0034426D2D